MKWFMTLRSCVSGAVGLIVLLGLGHSASAQKLIGQARSWPITITQPGSYKLRSNLTVPDANTTAILVQTNDVTIDLNGFAILGPTVCNGGPPVTSCTPTGTGIGIDGSASGIANTTVTNGSVRGMGKFGIDVNDGRVRNVGAYSNGDDGIHGATTVTGSEADSNGGTGIYASGIVTGCEADYNHAAGIGGTLVVNSTTNINGGAGIAFATTVANSSAANNHGDGIDSTTVTGSEANQNGGAGINRAITVANSTASLNSADGIDANVVTGCEVDVNGGRGITATLVTGTGAFNNSSDGIAAETMIGNDASDNSRVGLWGGIFAHSGYENNVLNSNILGGVGGATNIGENLCNGGACP